MNNNSDIVFHSVISSIQKVALYETKTVSSIIRKSSTNLTPLPPPQKLHLVGSNNQETRFRILDIDRTRPNELHIDENPNEIEARDIRRIVGSWGNCKKISAYGILGFVRFLESYYLILVTKRTRCAFVGMHLIYTIKDTTMVRVSEPSAKQSHPLEQRYLKMFQNIDLKSNFYFSYSYDLTRTLQYNLSAPRFVGADADIDADQPLPDWNRARRPSEPKERIEYAFRGISRKRFVWNAFLLRPMDAVMQRDWMLEVIHGFVSQSNVNIFGRPVQVCLVARRSTRFAGTRFLKRGANFTGDVANEVESEQIVCDGPQRMCAFVQMRGSIPSHWSQDVSKIVPKPQIAVDLADPYARTPGKHYERLLRQFGAPIIILNLVKKREKRKHESILTEEMCAAVKYLNQFLPAVHRIDYHHFDMARKSRGGSNVMAKLAGIATRVIEKTGFFFRDETDGTAFQTGLVRVNCVDCLDRTNTAQFAIGKCALAHQLCRLGFLRPAVLEFDSDCITMLESLYEDHGDTLALQYGGSQLVHRIKTYRKTAAWTSQGNDIMQTLSRYVSNTFSDTEKQHSINLFLGYFIPYENPSSAAIWELPTDYYMHNLQAVNDREKNSIVPLTQWVSPVIMRHLPYSTSDSNKIVKELIRVHSKDLEMIDFYSNYHLPYRWTAFEDHIAFEIAHLARNFMPTYRTNFSPFEPGRKREGRDATLMNPSLTGQSSTSSATGSNSSSMDEGSSSDDEPVTEKGGGGGGGGTTDTTHKKLVSFAELFPSMRQIYGSEPQPPTQENMFK